jgi:hypothetical protein
MIGNHLGQNPGQDDPVVLDGDGELVAGRHGQIAQVQVAKDQLQLTLGY